MSEVEILSPVDPMVTAIVDATMAHPLENGAADYERVRRAFVSILTEFIAPQMADVCQRMQDDFASELRVSIGEARRPKLNVVS